MNQTRLLSRPLHLFMCYAACYRDAYPGMTRTLPQNVHVGSKRYSSNGGTKVYGSFPPNHSTNSPSSIKSSSSFLSFNRCVADRLLASKNTETRFSQILRKMKLTPSTRKSSPRAG